MENDNYSITYNALLSVCVICVYMHIDNVHIHAHTQAHDGHFIFVFVFVYSAYEPQKFCGRVFFVKI